MYNSLLENSAFSVAIADTTGVPGSTGLDGTAVDMAGYDGVAFVAKLGVIPTGVTTGWVRLYPMVGSSSGAVTSCTGSGEYAYSTALSTGHDADLLVLDVRKPAHRWVGCHLFKDSTNAVSGNVIAIRYKSSYSPVTQTTADVVHSVTTLTPTTS